MSYWDDYEKKQPSKKQASAIRRRQNNHNMKELEATAKKAQENGMTYGQYVAGQYIQCERKVRLERKKEKDG